jgi:hypothetical protein
MLLEYGILPDLYGGLGNQMFIVAAAHVIARTQCCPFYLSYIQPERNPHNHNKHDYRHTIFRNFGVKLDMPMDHVRNACMVGGYSYFTNGGFQPWNPSEIKARTFVNSYFQYYPPLAPFETELRHMFLSGLQEYRNTLLETYCDLNLCAFLHIRRGDYLKLPDFHYNQPLEYYENATRRLFAEATIIPKRIFVLSDDPEWVRQQKLFTENPVYSIFESTNELETLAFMSLCTNGAICANSTFSWWGAFLGSYGSRNPVIVPSRWIAEPIVSLFPPEWVVL